MNTKTPNDAWYADVKIQTAIGGKPQIYIDGQLIRGVVSYAIEHSAFTADPQLTLKVQCGLSFDSKCIPLLPEPWTWFYEPKVDHLVGEL